jgi:methionyl-tRNA formyltransferase
MRVVFCGTPEIAVPTLRRLVAAPEHHVAGVVTQPDRPRGRRSEPAEPALKSAARAAGVQVFQPEKIRSPEAQAWLEEKAPDIAVLIAYGQILPARLLAIPRLGWINLHASLLPRYRGAAPIAWAIARGETRSGITIMQIDPGMDTGPILLQQEMEIGGEETAPDLSARMGAAGAPLILETLAGLEQGTLRAQPQDPSQATYAPMLKREDGRISWEMTSGEIYNRMRGFAPWPGTFAEFRGKRVHVWGRPVQPPGDLAGGRTVAPGAIHTPAGRMVVACGANSWLEISEVQPEGRKRMTAREFLSGARLGPDERLQ